MTKSENAPTILPCGCEKYSNGARTWCDACLADFDFKHPNQAEEKPRQVPSGYLKQAQDYWHGDQGDYDGTYLRLLFSIAESLERVAIALETTSNSTECVYPDFLPYYPNSPSRLPWRRKK